MIEKMCKQCSRTFPQYNTAQSLCGVCSFNKYFKDKKQKPITKRGKRQVEYEKWRDTVAIPYLKQQYGYKCDWCGATDQLDVDHIKPRGSRPDLKMELSNVRFLCRKCHTKRQ